MRFLPDHASAAHPVLPHLLEIHPVRSVSTERGLTFPAIVLDAPGGAEWTEVESVHPMPFADFQPRMRIALTGTILTFRDVPPVETAYAYMTGRFHGGRSQIIEGRPFAFAFGDAAGRTRITAVTIPGTPAYEMSRRWLSSPPAGPITVVGLRTLYLPALFAPGGGRIEVMLCPTFRIGPGTIRGSAMPAPTARFELVPIGGAPPAAQDAAPRSRGGPGRRHLRRRTGAASVPRAQARKTRTAKRPVRPRRPVQRRQRKRA